MEQNVHVDACNAFNGLSEGLQARKNCIQNGYHAKNQHIDHVCFPLTFP